MKSAHIVSLLLLVFCSCATQKKVANEISFTIVEKAVKNGSIVTLRISNQTNTNYYLPIVNLDESINLAFVLPREESDFFCLQNSFFNENLQELSWKTNNCFAESVIDEQLISLRNECINDRKNIKMEDLVLLKAGEQKTIKIAISSTVALTEDCTWRLKTNGSKKIKTEVTYKKRHAGLANKLLNTRVLAELEENEYTLYEKEIISNRIAFILE